MFPSLMETIHRLHNLQQQQHKPKSIALIAVRQSLQMEPIALIAENKYIKNLKSLFYFLINS